MFRNERLLGFCLLLNRGEWYLRTFWICSVRHTRRINVRLCSVQAIHCTLHGPSIHNNIKYHQQYKSKTCSSFYIPLIYFSQCLFRFATGPIWSSILIQHYFCSTSTPFQHLFHIPEEY